MPLEDSRFRIASVRPDSDLPQLDRDFDYEIPEEFADIIRVGSEVSIRLGKASNPIRGFVRQLKEDSEFSGRLSAIEGCSPFAVIPPVAMQLFEKLALRNSCNLAEVIRLGVPMATVRIANQLSLNTGTQDGESNPLADSVDSGDSLGSRTFRAIECSESGFREYFAKVALQSAGIAANGGAVLILAADESTQQRIQRIFVQEGVMPTVYSSTLTKSKRYDVFTKSLMGEHKVVIGGRSASLLAIRNLKKIFIWDEGDPNYADRTAPYIGVRETVALRQQIENLQLEMAGFVPSTSALRWIQSGFVQLQDEFRTRTKISFQESSTKFGKQSKSAINGAIGSGVPALVLTPSAGHTDAFYCSGCNERAACRFCGSSIAATRQSELACRTCSAPASALRCASCGSTSFEPGAGGAVRVVQELGKLYPGVTIRESSGTTPISQVSQEPQIIVSTVGVVPDTENGFGALVILEASRFLRREGFYAREDALRQWASVIGRVAIGGQVVFEGIERPLGQELALWNQVRLAQIELNQRAELAFPPVHRLATVTGAAAAIETLARNLRGLDGIKILGISKVQESHSQLEQEVKLAISYPHRMVETLAQSLRAEQLRLVGTMSRNKRSGRGVRPLRINMDDLRVI